MPTTTIQRLRKLQPLQQQQQPQTTTAKYTCCQVYLYMSRSNGDMRTARFCAMRVADPAVECPVCRANRAKIIVFYS